ncbi:beta strand repeat-containing protein [Radicibacter daui]|uniref:beta strand repeat-containing protein n=1 Tax=Radicibacter daui TaxID=3064829 RepID=UPI00404694F3
MATIAFTSTRSFPGFDMREGGFPVADVARSITRSTTQFKLVYSDGGYDDLTGTGFTYDENGDPTGGTITGWTAGDAGKQFASLTINISVSDFLTFAENDDWNGLMAFALGGDDQVSGTKGNDYLLGFDGNDTLNGGAGADTLVGGAGDDTYIIDNARDGVIEAGGEGTDLIQSSVSINLSSSTFSGQEIENVTLTGKASLSITGNELDNTLTGNAGANVIDGGTGADTMIGGAGNDTYVIDDAGDTVTELANGGTDLIKASVSIDLADYANVENITLTGTGNIDATGNDGANILTGNDGNNILDGGLGADTMTGGLGDDTYVVDNIKDKVVEAKTGTAGGTDTVQTSLASYSIASLKGIENLTYTGSSNFTGTGNTLANILTGGSGNDMLNGGAGADSLIGGGGDDTYIIDNIGDTVTEADGEGTDLIQSSVSIDLSAGGFAGQEIENITLTGKAAINATGNELDNILTGNAGANILTGGEGNDTLNGGAGADTLVGGAGDDTYIIDNARDGVIEAGGEGTDLIQSSVSINLSSSTFSGQEIENVTLTGKASLSITGNELDNTLTGNAGANVIDGGTGADTMIGGAGNDTYVIDDAGDTVTELANGGTDLIKASVSIDLADYANVENITLTGTGNIDATGNDGANILTGNDGNNILDGGLGADTMTGGLGDDTYVVDNIKDKVVEAKTGTAGGTDTVQTSLASYSIASLKGIENLTYTGSSNFTGTGNTLANILTGGSGNDMLNGGAGADSLIGGGGDDTYIIDNIGDTVTEADGEGTDLIQSSVSIDLSAGGFAGQEIENITLTGKAAINATGNELDNILTGNAGANILTGGEGNDTLNGGAGADTLVGGAGDDILIGGAGNDTYIISQGDGFDTITAGSYNTGDIIRFTDADRYDLWFDVSPDGTLTLAAAANENFDPDTDEYLTVESFFGGTGSITVQIDTSDNEYYGTNADLATIVIQRGLNGTNNKNTAEIIIGTTGNDVINGNGGYHDELYGGSGNDTINAGYGDDYLSGGSGDDILRSGAGDDVLYGGTGNDTLDGGAGYDVAYYSSSTSGVTASVSWDGRHLTGTVSDGLGGTDTLIDVEAIVGSSYDDTLTVDDYGIILVGGDGNDTLKTSAYSILYGDGGNDTLTADFQSELYGGEGDDKLTAGANSYLEGDDGDDTLNAGGYSILYGDAGNDTLTAGEQSNLYGGDDDDTLTAGGYSILYGDAGNDTLRAGVQSNLYGGDGDDTLTAASYSYLEGGDGNDTLGTGSYSYLDGGAGNDTLSAYSNSTVNGGDGDDYITAWFDCYVMAGAGDDNVTGGGYIYGEDGNDTISISGTGYEVDGGSGDDKIYGNTYSDTMYGGIGDDILDGYNGDDYLSGGDGDDYLIGNLGDDYLIGGAGSDIFSYYIIPGFSDGNDVIADFEIGTDTLKFAGVYDADGSGSVDIDDLIQWISSITDAGSGQDVTVNFQEGGKLTFSGIGTGSINSIDQIVSDSNHIIISSSSIR